MAALHRQDSLSPVDDDNDKRFPPNGDQPCDRAAQRELRPRRSQRATLRSPSNHSTPSASKLSPSNYGDPSSPTALEMLRKAESTSRESWKQLVDISADYHNRSAPIWETDAPERAIRQYPVLIFRSIGHMIINMRTIPKDAQARWPSFDELNRIQFLHHAFILTVYLASDEVTFSFEPGSFVRENLTARQEAWFEAHAKRWAEAALTRGWDAFLELVLHLGAFAHCVYDQGLVESLRLPALADLKEHWRVCGKQGYACRRV